MALFVCHEEGMMRPQNRCFSDVMARIIAHQQLPTLEGDIADAYTNETCAHATRAPTLPDEEGG